MGLWSIANGSLFVDREMLSRIFAQFMGSLTFYHVFVVSLWDIGLTSIHEQRSVHCT